MLFKCQKNLCKQLGILLSSLCAIGCITVMCGEKPRAFGVECPLLKEKNPSPRALTREPMFLGKERAMSDAYYTRILPLQQGHFMTLFLQATPQTTQAIHCRVFDIDNSAVTWTLQISSNSRTPMAIDATLIDDEEIIVVWSELDEFAQGFRVCGRRISSMCKSRSDEFCF